MRPCEGRRGEARSLPHCRTWTHQHAVSSLSMSPSRRSSKEKAGGGTSSVSPSLLLARMHQQRQQQQPLTQMPQLSPQQRCSSTPELPPDLNDHIQSLGLSVHTKQLQQQQQQQQQRQQEGLARAGANRPQLYSLDEAGTQPAALIAAAAAHWSSSNRKQQQQHAAGGALTAPQVALTPSEVGAACSCSSMETTAALSSSSSPAPSPRSAAAATEAAAGAAASQAAAAVAAAEATARGVLQGSSSSSSREGFEPSDAAGVGDIPPGDLSPASQHTAACCSSSNNSNSNISNNGSSNSGSNSNSSTDAAARAPERKEGGTVGLSSSSSNEARISVSSGSPLLFRVPARLLTSMACSLLPLGSIFSLSCCCRALLQLSIHHKWVEKAVRRGALEALSNECCCCFCRSKKRGSSRGDRGQVPRPSETGTAGRSSSFSTNSLSAALRGPAARLRHSSSGNNSSSNSSSSGGDRRVSPSALASVALKIPWGGSKERHQASLLAAATAAAAAQSCGGEGDKPCSCKRPCLVRQKYWLFCRGRVELLAEHVAAQLADATKRVHQQQQQQQQQREQKQQQQEFQEQQESQYTLIFPGLFEALPKGPSMHAQPSSPVIPRGDSASRLDAEESPPCSACESPCEGGSSTSSSRRPRRTESSSSTSSSSSRRKRRCFLPRECPRIFFFLLRATLPEPCADEIKRDVGRTFPTTAFFTTAKGQQKLYDVLHALACLDSQTGYCQGMNFMVGTLLQLCGRSRVHAFWLFLLFHRSLGYRLLHEGTMPLLTARTHQFDVTLKTHLPRLWEHLHRHWLSVSFFSTQWLLACFTAFLEVSLVACLWDVFFACGWKALIRAAVAVFRELEPHVLQQESLDNIIVSVQSQKHACTLLTCQGLFRGIEETPISNKHLTEVSFVMQAELLLCLLSSLPASFASSDTEQRQQRQQQQQQQHTAPQVPAAKSGSPGASCGVGAPQPASLRGFFLTAEALAAADIEPARWKARCLTTDTITTTNSSSSGSSSRGETLVAADMRGFLTRQYLWEGTWLHKLVLHDPSVLRPFAVSDSLRDLWTKCCHGTTSIDSLALRCISPAAAAAADAPRAEASFSSLTHSSSSSSNSSSSHTQADSSPRGDSSKDSEDPSSSSRSGGKAPHALRRSNFSGARYCLWGLSQLRSAKWELTRIEEETRSDLMFFQRRVQMVERQRQQLRKHLSKQQRKLQQLLFEEEIAQEEKKAAKEQLQTLVAAGPAARSFGPPRLNTDAAGGAAFAAAATGAHVAAAVAGFPAAAHADAAAAAMGPVGNHRSVQAVLAGVCGPPDSSSSSSSSGEKAHVRVRQAQRGLEEDHQTPAAAAAAAAAAALVDAAAAQGAASSSTEGQPRKCGGRTSSVGPTSSSSSRSSSRSSSLLSLPVDFCGVEGAGGEAKGSSSSSKAHAQRKDLMGPLLKKVAVSERRYARARAAAEQQVEVCSELRLELRELTDAKDRMQLSMSAFIESQEQKRLSVSQQLLQQASWLSVLPPQAEGQKPQPLLQLLLSGPPGGDTAAAPHAAANSVART
ncbi:hypothetical protein Esti_003707 [Eimeria stiedai]